MIGDITVMMFQVCLAVTPNKCETWTKEFPDPSQSMLKDPAVCRKIGTQETLSFNHYTTDWKIKQFKCVPKPIRRYDI